MLWAGNYPTDPVAGVLGKDVAQLIYRYVHQITLKELHKEYYGSLKKCNEPFFADQDIICFFEKHTNRGEFLFNWRSESYVANGGPISKWSLNDHRRKDPNVSLHRNYWHSWWC